MTKEEFKKHRFDKGDTVLFRGKPVHVVGVSLHSLTVRDGQNYATILPAEVELIGASSDVEFR